MCMYAFLSKSEWSSRVVCLFLSRYHPIQAAMKIKHIPSQRLNPQLSRNLLNKSFGYSRIAAISDFMKRLELIRCWCHKQQYPLRQASLNSCRHPNSMYKTTRDVVSDWLSILRYSTRNFIQDIYLQCTLKFLKHSLPTLLLESMVHSSWVHYELPLCLNVACVTFYANGYVSSGHNLKAPASNFNPKLPKKYLTSRCEFGATIKPQPPT